MSIEIIISGVIGVAAVYILIKNIKKKSEGGCGCGCGCGKCDSKPPRVK